MANIILVLSFIMTWGLPLPVLVYLYRESGADSNSRGEYLQYRVQYKVNKSVRLQLPRRQVVGKGAHRAVRTRREEMRGPLPEKKQQGRRQRYTAFSDSTPSSSDALTANSGGDHGSGGGSDGVSTECHRVPQLHVAT